MGGIEGSGMSASNWWRTVKMPFGKHASKTMFQIVKSHPDYMQWAIDNDMRPNDAAGEAFDEAIKCYREGEMV